MHVAILDEELPYPPTSGKRIRTYNLVKRLATTHRITYLCHQNANPHEARNAETHLKHLGIEPRIVPRSVPPKRGWRFAARLFANLFSPLPYSVVTHRSRALSQAIRELAAAQRIDLWHCEWTPYAESVKTLANVPWVVMAHNVESTIWQRLAENESNPARRWYIQHQHRKFRTFERWAYSHATRCIAVSDLDAHQLRREFGARQVDVVDNGVDIDFFTPSAEPRDPATVLFLGSLDWRPNLDAVRLLIDRVFPEVRRERPQTRLQIVGRNPPEWLWQSAERPGVEIHANVADVRPFLRRATLLAVPLRIGGGSRLKILEALACGTPVVSTRIGAEGLDLNPGIHLDLVDDIPQMADAMIQVLRDPTRRHLQTLAGRRLVVERYGWDILATKLDEAWCRAVQIVPLDQAA